MKAAKFPYNEQRVINALAQFNTELDEHVGRQVRFLNPSCIVENETFVIRHIQKNFKGELCYNLIAVTENHMGEGFIGSPAHQFGRVTSIEKIYFI